MAEGTRSEYQELVQCQDAQEERMQAMREDIAQLTDMVQTLVNNQAQVIQREPNFNQDMEL